MGFLFFPMGLRLMTLQVAGAPLLLPVHGYPKVCFLPTPDFYYKDIEI